MNMVERMTEDTGKKKLGRGLSALLGDDAASDYSELDKIRASKEIPVEQMHPSPFQPRQDWDQEALQSLADSIAEKGILQPILVRRDPLDAGLFEIIAGERRWRAAQMAQLHQVPVIIKELSDVDSLEIAIIENIQREDLSAIEEAEGYRRLTEEFEYTQEVMAKQLGKSRSHVTNMMRLLSLPESVQKMIRSGELSAGAARTLVTADDPEKLARKIVSEGLSVRAAEKLAKKKPSNRASSASPSTKDQDTLALEGDLSAAIGMKVSIDHKGDHGGSISIHYGHLDQLDDICRRLTRQSMAENSEEDPFDGDISSALDEDFH
ncbi:MAG: ParB family chromosome partitioning protein [Sneathiella sp.]|jgi:ParB family chromosome partitioning protein